MRFPARRIGGHPKRGIDSPQIERGGVTHQRSVPAAIAVFMEVRHRELAQAPVNGIAIAQSDVIAFRDRAPRAPTPKKCDHMRPVRRIAVEMHHQGRAPIDPQCAGGDERAFDAMCSALAEHFAHGQYSLAVGFVIRRNRVDESLDPFRRGESFQDRTFACGKAGARNAGWRSTRSGHAVRLHRSTAPLTPEAGLPKPANLC